MNSPFNGNILRDWFINHFELMDIGINSVISLGSGPFEESEFDEFLNLNGITSYNPHENIEMVIVGTDNWDEDF